MDYNEDQLKARAAKGDERAFKALFDRYQGRLFGYIQKMVKSGQVAEELVMDVFMKLWISRETLPEIQRLDSFLFRVAHNKTIDFFRMAARDGRFVDLVMEQMDQATLPDAHNNLVSKEYDEELRKALALLPERRKEIYRLSREAGMSHEEIAKKLNISKNTVANTLVDAKKFIREYLQKRIGIISLMCWAIFR